MHWSGAVFNTFTDGLYIALSTHRFYTHVLELLCRQEWEFFNKYFTQLATLGALTPAELQWV